MTWGGDLKILSTHNGKQSLYFRMLEAAKAGKSAFKAHYTDIFLAVQEGLADKIAGRTLTDVERAAWIEEQRLSCVDEETWQQEYCCIPVDEATAFLTYELIEAVEDQLAGMPEQYLGGDLYAGMDIGRRRDLTVIWVLERVGDVYWTREVVTMKGVKFAAQESEVARLMAQYPTLRRICIDQTGMGEKFVEDVQATHGAGRVEGVLMTSAVKQELAFGLKRRIEDRLIRLPRQAEVRDDFHSVRKVTTVAGNIRFDAERTDQGHADRFFAAALAVHAIESGPPAAGVSGDAARTDWTARRQEILSGAGAQRHYDRRGRLWFSGGGRR